MGLSSSKTKTTSNTSQNTNQTENGTTTPVAPDWLTGAAQDYVGRIGAFGDMDPNGFVAGASPLQQSAWQNAGNLGDWRGQAATAADMAQDAGMGGPSFAGQTPTKTNGIVRAGRDIMMAGGGGQMQADQMAASAPAGTGGQMQRPMNAFSGASSGLVSGQGYNMAPGSPGYAMPRQGAPIGASGAQGYDAAQAAPATIQRTPGATATNADAASLLDNFSAYQNPYTQQVVDTTLANYDQQAGQTQAQLAAQGARNGAFGGSRFGIAQGQLMGDQDRNRASMEATLRDQGFNTAAGLSQSDAANRQQVNLFNAQNQTQNSQFNSGQDAARAQAQAQLYQQGNQYNAGALDQAGQYNATANNQMSQFNAGQQDNALNRQLAAAGLLGQQAQDYGAGTRADLGSMAALGDQQRNIEQAYAMAGPAQLQMMGQLSGMTPYDILVGRQVNGNTTGSMTGTGTQTTTASPSLFSMLMQGAGAASAFI